MLYSLGLQGYRRLIQVAGLFNTKAKLLYAGERKSQRELATKIDPKERYIWFHAASLGEFEQGRPLMEYLKRHHPEYKLLLTFFSPSGYEVCKDYKGADVVCYLPFDTPKRVAHFLDTVHPVMALFIKYEFWRNYLKALHQRAIPTYSVSAIFRPEQAFFKWYGAPYRALLKYFNQIFVQDEASRALLTSMGVTAVTLTGDTRFDRVLAIAHEAKPISVFEGYLKAARKAGERILVAGSSWPQDERFLLPYLNERIALRAIIAPHEIHEAHLQAIEKGLQRPSIRLSKATPDTIASYPYVIIDCFGLLSTLYRYADVAYVGGGFGVSIHNTVEAAVYGVPVLFGPVHDKFREAKELLASGGGIGLTVEADFAPTMDRLLANETERKQRGEAAKAYVTQQAGATRKILSALALDSFKGM